MNLTKVGGTTICEQTLLISLLSTFSFHAAELVLKEYRKQFISEMDANAVINEFLYMGLIPAGVHQKLTETDCPKQQNELLHACLLRTYTNEALMRACDIISSVRGNPKMSTLGKDMQRRLDSGVCACVCACVRACVCACMRVCMRSLVCVFTMIAMPICYRRQILSHKWSCNLISAAPFMWWKSTALLDPSCGVYIHGPLT